MEGRTEVKSNAGVVPAAICAVILALVVVFLGLGQATSAKDAESLLSAVNDLGLSVRVDNVTAASGEATSVVAFEEYGELQDGKLLAYGSSLEIMGVQSASKTPFYSTDVYLRLVTVLMDYWEGADRIVAFNTNENSLLVLLGLPDGQNFIKLLEAKDSRTVAKWKNTKNAIQDHCAEVKSCVDYYGYSEVSVDVIVLETLDVEKAAADIEAGTFAFNNTVLWNRDGVFKYAYL